MEHTLSGYKQGDKGIKIYYSGVMEIWSKQDQIFGGNLSSKAFTEVMFEGKKIQVFQLIMKLRRDFQPIRPNNHNSKTVQDIAVVFGELIREDTHINTWHPWVHPTQMTRRCIH